MTLIGGFTIRRGDNVYRPVEREDILGARRLADERQALPTSGKNPIELGFGKLHQPSEYPSTPAVLFKCLTKFIQRDMAFLLQLGLSYEVPILYPSILKDLRPAIMLPYVTFYSDKRNDRSSARWSGNSAVPIHIAWVGFCLVYENAVTSCEVSALLQEYPVSPFSISLRCRHRVMDSKPVVHLFELKNIRWAIFCVYYGFHHPSLKSEFLISDSVGDL